MENQAIYIAKLCCMRQTLIDNQSSSVPLSNRKIKENFESYSQNKQFLKELTNKKANSNSEVKKVQSLLKKDNKNILVNKSLHNIDRELNDVTQFKNNSDLDFDKSVDFEEDEINKFKSLLTTVSAIKKSAIQSNFSPLLNNQEFTMNESFNLKDASSSFFTPKFSKETPKNFNNLKNLKKFGQSSFNSKIDGKKIDDIKTSNSQYTNISFSNNLNLSLNIKSPIQNSSPNQNSYSEENFQKNQNISQFVTNNSTTPTLTTSSLTIPNNANNQINITLPKMIQVQSHSSNLNLLTNLNEINQNTNPINQNSIIKLRKLLCLDEFVKTKTTNNKKEHKQILKRHTMKATSPSNEIGDSSKSRHPELMSSILLNTKINVLKCANNLNRSQDLSKNQSINKNQENNNNLNDSSKKKTNFKDYPIKVIISDRSLVPPGTPEFSNHQHNKKENCCLMCQSEGKFNLTNSNNIEENRQLVI